MTKLSFSKPTYNVNKDKKVVVCIYNCTIMHNNIPKNTFTAIGKAQCSENDKFDERYGKILADSRAKKYAYKIVLERFHCAADKAKKVYTIGKDIIDFYSKYTYLYKAENEHIKYILNNEVHN